MFYQVGLFSSGSAELKILAYLKKKKKKCISSCNSQVEMLIRDYRLMEKEIGALIVPASCFGVL